MDIKRISTALLGLPLVILCVIFGNKYIVDAIFAIMAVICMHEYLTAIEKVAHPIKWIAYASILIIVMASIFALDALLKLILFAIPIILLIMFLKVIITNMETNFKDVAYTFFGICYITFFISFLALIRGFSIDDNLNKALIGYVLLVAWSTDIFAYIIGKRWGNHKFSKISPKKSIEGCIAGIVGSIICSVIYWILINNCITIVTCEGGAFDILKKISDASDVLYTLSNPWIVAIITLILSIISQIGDFVASSIKRFTDVKDFGNLLPGHGGILDRIDSLIFIAPFLYMIIDFIVMI